MGTPYHEPSISPSHALWPRPVAAHSLDFDPPGPRVMPHWITMNFGGLRHLLLCPRQSLNCARLRRGWRRHKASAKGRGRSACGASGGRCRSGSRSKTLIGRLYALNVTHAMVRERARTIGHRAKCLPGPTDRRNRPHITSLLRRIEHPQALLGAPRGGASSGRGVGRRRHFRADAATSADDLAEGLAGPLTDRQAAASPAVVSVSASSWTISQP